MKLNPAISARDHVLGADNAPVTLTEYGDYECPHCGAAHPVVQELRRLFGNELRFSFRNFPLTQVHPHAFQAAEASEAAGVQGKFWEMHDRLFDNQDSLEMEDLIGFAEAIGLNVERFSADLESGEFSGRVREDVISGLKSGVNGTPTFFINGVRYNGSWDLDSLTSALRAAASRDVAA